jgi:hypothetical protein
MWSILSHTRLQMCSEAPFRAPQAVHADSLAEFMTDAL